MNLDDDFANAAHIPDGGAYPERWAAAAAAFRAEAVCELDLPYGEGPRQCFDLFHPPRLARGAVIFVHGGYWMRFDKSFWSHLAAGPLAHGWAVAMPSYDLCPDVRITDIGQQIGEAIATIAERVPGPIRLTGHSAGGQLVARAVTQHSRWRERVAQVLPISPLGDLAPLMQTSMNATLQLDADEAAAESPVNLPAPPVPVTLWVGAAERPVFIDQARQLSEHWACPLHVAPERHHFDVISDLAEPDTAMVARLLQ